MESSTVAELGRLESVLAEVARPFVLVCGGARADDKLPVLRRLGAHADEVLVGGRLAEQLRVSNVLEIPVSLPSDVVGVEHPRPDAEPRACHPDELPYGWVVLDIGPGTAARFVEVIGKARTIVWNGPMGLCEWPRFAAGTAAVARAIAASSAFSVVAGTETVRAVAGLGLLDRVTRLQAAS